MAVDVDSGVYLFVFSDGTFSSGVASEPVVWIREHVRFGSYWEAEA